MPMYKHIQAKTKNDQPEYDAVNSVKRCRTPSTPSTKPTKLAVMRRKRFVTPPMPARGRYHRSWPYCLSATTGCGLTFSNGTVARAAISGNRNKLTSHPQASSLNDRSCHRATNVKTSRVAAATFLDPPTGMYRYLPSAPCLTS